MSWRGLPYEAGASPQSCGMVVKRGAGRFGQVNWSEVSLTLDPVPSVPIR